MTAAVAKETGLIPEADEKTLRLSLRAFSASETKLYKHATEHKWTVEELVSTILMILKVAETPTAIAHGV